MGSLMGLGKWINSWGKLYSQNALHVESAKQIFTTIPILVVEHALSLRHVFNVFALFFPVCLFTILFIYGQTPGPNWFSTFCSEWSSFNAEIIHIYLKKKIIPSNKESLFALNHLIYILSIYIYIYIYDTHNNLFSAIAVGTSYSAWARVTVGG